MNNKAIRPPTPESLLGIPAEMENQETHTTYERYYFKDSGTRPWTPLMSGLALPIEADGAVHNKTFKSCEFHPCCGSVRFIDCEFIDCEDPTKW